MLLAPEQGVWPSMTTTSDPVRRFVETGRLAGNGGRLVELDALRGMAIAGVVAFHLLGAMVAKEPTQWVGWLAQATSAGWLGVDLFFVLSGFLIGSILLENREAPNLFFVFYLRRAARLLPIYLLVVFAYLWARHARIADAGPSLGWLVDGYGPGLPSWSYLVYLQNVYQAAMQTWGGHWLAPTWSLAVEEQFYLVAPLLVCTIPRDRLAGWITALIFASLMHRAWACFISGNWFDSYVSLASRADTLLIGVAGALAVSDPGIRRRLSEAKGLLLAGQWLAIVLFAAVTIADIKSWNFGMVLVGQTVAALLSLNLIFVALFTDGWFRRSVLGNKVLIEIGGVSYAVYLLHQPIYGLAGWLAGSAWTGVANAGDVALAVAAALSTVVAAKISGLWIERPFIEFGHRLRYRSAYISCSPEACDGTAPRHGALASFRSISRREIPACGEPPRRTVWRRAWRCL